MSKVARKFRWTLSYCAFMIVVMIVLANLPESLASWRIDTFATIFPLGMMIVGHVLCPIALNPSLMLFTW